MANPRRHDETARRLIIHCGVQKTASTSFHHFVRRNQSLLGQHAVILTPAKGSPMRELGRAAMRYSLHPTSDMADKLAGFAATLRDSIPDGAEPILLSHENLPGAMIGKAGVTTLYPHVEQIIQVLTAQFAPLVPEFVFYTRDMAAWKTSVYNQAVRSDYYAHSRDVFLAETAKCGSWSDLRHRIEALVGVDHVRFFEMEQEHEPGKPGVSLLRHLGLDAAVIAALEPMDGRRNTSLNAGALEFLRLINGLNLARSDRTQVAGLIGANPSLFVSDLA